MDLNRIYKLLPVEDQEKIRKIFINYLNDCALFLGCKFVDRGQAEHIVSSTPAAEKKRRQVRVGFPIKIHGRSFPNSSRLIDLYRDSEGAWEGKISWLKIRALYAEGLSWEEIFPEPPKAETVSTILKRKDNEGNSYVALN